MEVNSAFHNLKEPILSSNFWVTDANFDRLYMGSCCIYYNGKWAKKADCYVPKEIGIVRFNDNSNGLIFGDHVLHYKTAWTVWRNSWNDKNCGDNYRITDEKPDKGDLCYLGRDKDNISNYGFIIGAKIVNGTVWYDTVIIDSADRVNSNIRVSDPKKIVREY